MLGVFVLLLLPVVVVQVADAACANSCSGHGRCGASNQCTCDADWALAPDCSLRKCPTGVAWTDKAKTANAAHAVAECSNRGVCDYSKGECTCFNGYTGAACQRLRCPSDCSGHGLCYSSATLASQYGPSSLAGSGPTYTNWEKDSMTSCMCDMGYNGPDCSQFMCAKNDDPLTTGQAYRTIQIAVGADPTPATALAGSVRVHFLGDVAVFSAVAGADAAHETACAQAFQSMRTVLTATCTITSVDSVTKGAIYTVAFTEWVHLGGENNLLYHTGNPPLSSFTCDLSQVTSLNSPSCVVTDVAATNVIEHVYCSNRGLCDFSSGQCVCYTDFKGMDCNQPSNIPDSIDDNDGFIINPLGLAYTGTVLHLKTAKGSQADFYFMKIESSTLPILTMNGMGDTNLLNGDLQLSTGSLTITTIAQTSTAADIANTHPTFTNTVLKVRASRLLNTGFKLFEAMVGDTNTVVDIRGDGLTTIYTGGLSVVTGGGIIANTVDAPSLTVTNSFGTFSSSLLKLSTSRATQYPGASDFLLIEASANSVPAFTVEASGRTTISNGGLIVSGLGGGQISNSDTAASALVVSATSTSFVGDAVAIKTFSGSAHNMLKVTTRIAPAAPIDLFTIANSGLTTITQTGLYITSGGATVNAGGIHIINGGETIDFGGLRVKDGGGTIELGGLNVIDGGGTIATTAATTDVLTVEATATTFSSNARVLHINSKSTVLPATSMHYLLEATVGATSTSVFKVDATGLATIAGQGSGGASISDKGTTANTLTLTNSAASFNQKVLGMVATDTNGYSFIDATVGSTSVYNVDASGLTTIVGQGSGGASISDSSTTTDTITVANTATTGFSGALLAMSSTSSDKLYKFIDAQVASVSVFKVAASGLATIAGQGSGGASISDKGTTANTLTLTNSAASFNQKVLGMVATDTNGYSFIDATVGSTSVFNVDASGLTTIVGQGSGGASISDSSTSTTDTITVANTATTGFSGALLAMSSTSSDKLYRFIDAQVASVSVFKVAASGLTTIAGQGSGGASIFDKGTTANTLSVANSVTSGFTGALLSMNAVSSTTSYTLIDAKSSGTSRFKVVASGLTTISAGGLSVTGGVTVVDTGLTVTTGGASISDSSASSTNTLTVANSATSGFTGALLAMSSTSSTTGYSFIDGKVGSTSVFKVAGTGLATIAGQGSGGASVSDTGTTANTLTVANSVSTGFTGAVLSLNAVSSTTVYSLIDATVGAGSTPRFNVAATGLTTIVGSGSGGASISDSGTATSTLSVANSVSTGFTGALLSMNAVSSTTAYTLIDAKSSGTSRFKVAASGLTTISAGGLSVTGGVTVVDTGLTVTTGGASLSDSGTTTNTLTVANSATTGFTGALLAMSSTSSTTGYSFIDGKVGSTSVFKVGGTGLATIAGQGSGGASISDTGTTANTLTVANSVSTGFTGTLLSMNAVSTTTSYTLIDAQASGTSKFTVAASGLTTIASGGLTVTTGGVTIGAGGLVVSAGGATVTAGGLTVSAGGASISDNQATVNTLSVANSVSTGFTGALLSMNAVSSTTAYTLIDAKSSGTSRFKVAASGLTTISAGGLSVTGGVTVVDTGLTVSAGGASIAGGATIAGGVTVSNTGLTVTTGGAAITDTGTSANTLTLTNSASSFNKAILAMVSTATTGFSVIDAKVGSTSVFNVAPSGLTTISAGGLSVSGGATIAGGVTVSNTGLTVSGGGATIAGGATITGSASISGGATMSGGVTVSGGGASITGGITAVDTGVTVTTGGARIYDTGTSAETLTVKNTASGITKALLYLDSTAASGFPLIDAKVAGTSQFTVTAAGRTTIASGGFTVSAGGAVITAGGLSVAGDGATIAGGATITGSASISGGATIAGGVTVSNTGLTVTTGGAAITDTGTSANTLTLTNSASSFNKAILAMVSTATTGFSVIDAKVGSTSVFNVAPSGLTTISAGGLSVSGGATIAGGVTVSNTGLTVSGGGATIAGGVTVSNTGLTVSGGGATIAGGATITGSASISGGASITGGITAVDTGVTVTTGGARIYDTGTSAETLTVKNTASGITKALLYLDSTETSGFPLIDAKVAGTSQFTVTAAGLTAIASGGLSVKGGVTVVDTGVTVSAGVVGISDTTASTVSTDGALVVSGGVGIGGSIRCAGTSYAVTHTNTSDRRLKTAIKNLTAAQETIRRLRPVTYEWRRDEFPSRNFPTGVFPGFLADEVEQILPDLVQQDGDGWKSMDYVGIVPHLVRAVQEMQDQLEASQAQMTRMQQQIDALLAAVAA
ncbi:hypothetical protein PF001_g5962 [Phytophthora fragariae]|uniref:EGF-like domain-containing protein n=1 Tax=Phytophthora fragariae TaxID=53985 RepID=A0A6A4EKD3_9STRA|nr:hypothetical protein PF001_g5962 [Phytophthora fragariae]